VKKEMKKDKHQYSNIITKIRIQALKDKNFRLLKKIAKLEADRDELRNKIKLLE